MITRLLKHLNRKLGPVKFLSQVVSFHLGNRNSELELASCHPTEIYMKHILMTRSFQDDFPAECGSTHRSSMKFAPPTV